MALASSPTYGRLSGSIDNPCIIKSPNPLKAARLNGWCWGMAYIGSVPSLYAKWPVRAQNVMYENEKVSDLGLKVLFSRRACSGAAESGV